MSNSNKGPSKQAAKPAAENAVEQQASTDAALQKDQAVTVDQPAGDQGASTQAANGNVAAAEGAAVATAPEAGAAEVLPASDASAGAANSEAGGEEAAAAAKPNPNPQEVEIWPLRTYQDAGEIKRRGGKSYTVPKRHADALIARGLATDEESKG